MGEIWLILFRIRGQSVFFLAGTQGKRLHNMVHSSRADSNKVSQVFLFSFGFFQSEGIRSIQVSKLLQADSDRIESID